LDRHYVRIGCGCLFTDLQLMGIDPVSTTIAAYVFARGVLSHQTHCEQRKWDLKARQVDQHVVRASPIAGGFPENVSEAILDRINIDDLRPINDPVTTGQDASALGLGRIQELSPFKRALGFSIIWYSPATKGSRES
jgi:hypothetical protein